MIVHFANRAAAVAHLVDNGWAEIANGNWVSRNKSCVASIHPRFNQVVAIAFREFAAA